MSLLERLKNKKTCEVIKDINIHYRSIIVPDECVEKLSYSELIAFIKASIIEREQRTDIKVHSLVITRCPDRFADIMTYSLEN